ncbi:hypothetical protein LCGC14_0910960 [marine sediment metagenome]|uniref:Uncharacterized protein n=1 Tax=marine sediment metagenome TaxID=412755 RepID=A0A0F9NTQ8_9ZZZZ|nr:hypothetical protein [Candidatus Aminicenantes bacterium]
MEWSDILNSVKNGIEDLATLEVLTLTGDVTTSIIAGDKVAWAELLEKVQAGSGEIRLVAATKMMIDSDVIQFVAGTASDQPNLLRLHDAAVQTAQENRRAVIDFVRTVLGVIP